MSQPKRLKFRRDPRQLKRDFNRTMADIERALATPTVYRGCIPALQERRPIGVADIHRLANELDRAAARFRPRRCALIEVLALLPRCASAVAAACRAQDHDLRTISRLKLKAQLESKPEPLDIRFDLALESKSMTFLQYGAGRVQVAPWPSISFIP